MYLVFNSRFHFSLDSRYLGISLSILTVYEHYSFDIESLCIQSDCGLPILHAFFFYDITCFILLSVVNRFLHYSSCPDLHLLKAQLLFIQLKHSGGPGGGTRL